MENFKSSTKSRCNIAHEHQSLKLHCPQCRAKDCLENHSHFAWLKTNVMSKSNYLLLYESSILLNTHTKNKQWNKYETYLRWERCCLFLFLMKAKDWARAERVESSIHRFSQTDKSGRGRTHATPITETRPYRNPRAHRCDIWSYSSVIWDMNEIYHEWNMRMRDMSSRAPAWSRAGPNLIHFSEIYQRYYYNYINQQESYKT